MAGSRQSDDYDMLAVKNVTYFNGKPIFQIKEPGGGNHPYLKDHFLRIPEGYFIKKVSLRQAFQELPALDGLDWLEKKQSLRMIIPRSR